MFSNKILVLRAGIHKFLVRIANWEDPDNTASSEADLGLPSLSMPFWQASSDQNFRTFTVDCKLASSISYLPQVFGHSHVCMLGNFANFFGL